MEERESIQGEARTHCMLRFINHLAKLFFNHYLFFNEKSEPMIYLSNNKSPVYSYLFICLSVCLLVLCFVCCVFCVIDLLTDRTVVSVNVSWRPLVARVWRGSGRDLYSSDLYS